MMEQAECDHAGVRRYVIYVEVRWVGKGTRKKGVPRQFHRWTLGHLCKDCLCSRSFSFDFGCEKGFDAQART